MFLIDVAGFEIWGERPHGEPAPVFLSEGGFEGWDDTPEIRRSSIARVNGHGEFDADGFLTARTASFSGQVVTGSKAQTAELGRRLRGVLSYGQSGRVTVHRDELTEWADGRLAGSTKFTVHGSDPTVADWQMQLWFPDPRKYGQLNTEGPAAGGGPGVTIKHFGNTWAASQLVIAGEDANGYVLLGPSGRRIEVNLPLTPGNPHFVDTATGQVSVAGSTKYGVLGEVDLWETAPGKTTTVALSNTASTNTVTVNTWDTYL